MAKPTPKNVRVTPSPHIQWVFDIGPEHATDLTIVDDRFAGGSIKMTLPITDSSRELVNSLFGADPSRYDYQVIVTGTRKAAPWVPSYFRLKREAVAGGRIEWFDTPPWVNHELIYGPTTEDDWQRININVVHP